MTLQSTVVPLNVTDEVHGAVAPGATSRHADDRRLRVVTVVVEVDEDAIVVLVVVEVANRARHRRLSVGQRARLLDDQLVRARLDEVTELANDDSSEEEPAHTDDQRDRCQHQPGHRETSTPAVVAASVLQAEICRTPTHTLRRPQQ